MANKAVCGAAKPGLPACLLAGVMSPSMHVYSCEGPNISLPDPVLLK